MAEGFELRGVVVHRGDRTILDRVGVVVPAEGVTVLWGPSGAGKTTLLRLLNRLDVPEEGTVAYGGVDLDRFDARDLRRRVGMVFQQPTPFAGSVADNLAVAAPDADRDAMARALGQVSLDVSVLDRDADTLSGGETQRMCLARTLITQPEALLLDEPTSALDEGPAREFEASVLDLAGRGLTVVWIGHDEPQVIRVADRVLELHDGAVVPGEGWDLDRVSGVRA